MQTHKITLKRWTKREDDFLRANYSGMAVSALAKQLNRGEKATRTRLERLGCRLSTLERNKAKPRPNRRKYLGWHLDSYGRRHISVKGRDISKYTTSTAIKQIIESKTYTFSTMLQAISLATVLLRQSSSHLWNEILSSLILIQEDTKYARLNNKNEKTVISESGTAHISAELQDSTEHFALGHLGGCCGRQVFPIYGNESEDHSPTLRATYHKGYQTRGPMIGKTVRSGGRGSPHGSKQNWDSYEFEGLIRRLTPTECERLQGYPDGWTGGASDTQRYKTLGNSVTVNVIQAIMEKLL